MLVALGALVPTSALADVSVNSGGSLVLGLTAASATAVSEEMDVESRFDVADMVDPGSVTGSEDGQTDLANSGTGSVASVSVPKPPTVTARPTKTTTTKTSSKTTAKKTYSSSVPIITTDSERQWSTAHLDQVAKEALAHYDVPKAEWSWVLAANRNVAYRESKNRPGAKSSGGDYQGMHQWSDAWGGANRLDGEWSVYRFVRVYAEGGRAKIRQHWSATVGL